MRKETKTFLLSLPGELTIPRAVFFLFMVFLVGNLSALVDAVLHPDIPYFDEEHLIIGGAYALFLTVMFLMLTIYLVKLKMVTMTQRESEKNYRNLFDRARDIIFTMNRDTLFTALNLAFEKITGWSREEWLGRSFEPILHPEDLPKARAMLNRLMQGETVDMFELRVLKKSGEYFVGEFTTTLLKQGETISALGHVRDITERKLIEARIRTLTENLELKVEERTKQLLEAQQELIRKEKLATLGQLSESVGHELRNPMGVISNAVYFLQTVLPDADETVREYLGIIKGEVNNSQRIITDLMDFTRTRIPQKDMVRAEQLIKQSIEECMVPPNISLQVNVPDTLPALAVDPLQLNKVFQNLITNAVQAMPKGGQLKIDARKEIGNQGLEIWGKELTPKPQHPIPVSSPQSPTPDGNFIEISVADAGEGIAPENMKRLFQPLFTTKARGIGLGLSVAKNLIEANGGRIEVESQLGKGTTFTVILPAEV